MGAVPILQQVQEERKSNPPNPLILNIVEGWADAAAG